MGTASHEECKDLPLFVNGLASLASCEVLDKGRDSPGVRTGRCRLFGELKFGCYPSGFTEAVVPKLRLDDACA